MVSQEATGTALFARLTELTLGLAVSPMALPRAVFWEKVGAGSGEDGTQGGSGHSWNHETEAQRSGVAAGVVSGFFV